MFIVLQFGLIFQPAMSRFSPFWQLRQLSAAAATAAATAAAAVAVAISFEVDLLWTINWRTK